MLIYWTRAAVRRLRLARYPEHRLCLTIIEAHLRASAWALFKMFEPNHYATAFGPGGEAAVSGFDNLLTRPSFDGRLSWLSVLTIWHYAERALAW